MDFRIALKINLKTTNHEPITKNSAELNVYTFFITPGNIDSFLRKIFPVRRFKKSFLKAFNYRGMPAN